jgi:hypothetical protein
MIVLCCVAGLTVNGQKSYVLISQNKAGVNLSVIKQLPENLKAMAAYYSAIGGTHCMQQSCRLTTALGLGNQGSPEQIKLIHQYFPDDKVAKMVCGQNCYLPPDSSAAYSNFLYLSFLVSGNHVQVNYKLAVFDHNRKKMISGPDSYIYHDQVFKEQKRILYAWVDK